MDKTRKPLGVVTMVYEDYPMLQRWYDYYAPQVGPENLYVFSHGNDSRHRHIAVGANVINVPRDPAMVQFDIRRWRMMGDFASGHLNFYNWMLVTDVDEMVVADPAKWSGLVDYLKGAFTAKTPVPRSISPFALNIVHVPEEEPLPLVPGKTVLSRRRYYYPSRVYSKPTLVREPVVFGPGGHRNNLGLRTLSDDLYLVHLKFHDTQQATDRLARQAELVDAAAELNNEFGDKHVWKQTAIRHKTLRDEYTLGPEDIELPEIRAQMMQQVEKYTDRFVWGDITNSVLYQIPKRFADLV